MKLSARFFKRQLKIMRPMSDAMPLSQARKWHDRIGDIISYGHKENVDISTFVDKGLDMCIITPKDEITESVILYLHGGGYTTGDAPYAKGFGTVLASRYGCKVFAPAYRLAPEYVFPAALDDAVQSYMLLLSLGYTPDKIILCGESAGGGLCYSLCMRLRELALQMPAGIIAISPWSDLSLSGDSYEKNEKNDPSITKEKLEFYANCYIYGKGVKTSELSEQEQKRDTELKRQPLASPLFGELEGMPPSLIFVGEDEIMLDDAVSLNDKLLLSGARSKIVIEPQMWHAYPLYGMVVKETESTFLEIYAFLRVVAPSKKKLRWMALDNSAKIFPAARRRNWSSLFRLSATLDEDVNIEYLKNAVDITARRFPSMAVRLKSGMFWYYVEEVPSPPEIAPERSFPLSRMATDDIKKCAFRVIVYKSRIAVEFFHALTDGNGGLVFLKTLLAEYLKLRYSAEIPPTDGVLDTLEEPSPEELEDSFVKISSNVCAKRGDSVAFNIEGTKEKDDFTTNTTFIFNTEELLAKAKSHGVTLTAYMCALMAKSCLNIQENVVKNPKKRKHVKFLVPVNLRKIYNSKTLRNFVLYVSPGVDARLGNYEIDELCKIFSNQMKLMITEKQLSSRIATNVRSEKTMFLKLAPLFVKNIVMKLIYAMVGERTVCFPFSNLGVVTLPEPMKEFVKRMDFILGVQTHSPYSTALLTYEGTTYLNVIRNIKEPILERALYDTLKSEGLRPRLESNSR